MADLESIISNATAAAEAGGMTSDAGISDSGETSAPSAPSAPEGAEPAAAPAEGEQQPEGAEEGQQPEAEADVELTAAELAAPMIPVSRHKAVLTRTRNELEKATQQLAHYTSEDVQNRLKAVEIADTNPELFVDVLLSDERYLPILQAKLGAGRQQGPGEAAPPAQAAAAVAPGRPEPDTLLPDGSLGYSAAAMQRLLEHEAKQYEDRFKSMLDERFKPLDERQQAERIFADAHRRQSAIVAEAEKSWPLFKESKPEIHAFIKANPRATLEEAYRTVVIPKLQSNETEMRKRIYAELNKRPAAAVSGPAQSVPNPAGAPRTMEQIIAEATARAEASGM